MTRQVISAPCDQSAARIPVQFQNALDYLRDLKK